MQKDKVIVSFANHARENYNKALLGMIKSTIGIWDGDYHLRSTDSYVDEYLNVKIKLGEFPTSKVYGICYPHASVPYQFKVFMIQEAIDMGYTKVLWLDSTMRLNGDTTALFDKAKEKGIVAFNNEGHPLKDWISDKALNKLGINEEQLALIPQIMACGIVFDFANEKCKTIFNQWIKLSTDGESFHNYVSVREGFKGHRHDQAVLSALLWQNGVELEPYGGLCYYPQNETKEFGEPIYFYNKGVD